MAPGRARKPLPRAAVFAIVGAGGFSNLLDFPLGLLVARGAPLRLPGDLAETAGGSPVGP
eukprot:2296883-Pyramimonas_sp.AAC.1